jgi:hypothetical protein
MQITSELVTNVLDLISFLLITPEVLGPTRAKAIREAVLKMFNDPDIGTSITLALGALLLFGVSYLITSGILPSPGPADRSGWLSIVWGLGVFVVLFGGCLFVAFMTIQAASDILENRPLLRQRLLYAGGVLFLTARVIAIWHAVSAMPAS